MHIFCIQMNANNINFVIALSGYIGYDINSFINISLIHKNKSLSHNYMRLTQKSTKFHKTVKLPKHTKTKLLNNGKLLNESTR